MPAVLIKKTQMSSDPAQCGLTSLLPMSCRGRAEAFARRLHTRLRSLGAESGESSWLAAHAPPQRDHGLFLDFELECVSPSSPAEPAEDLHEVPKPKSNGDIRNGAIDFSMAYLEERSPVKKQPVRENGHAQEKRLYSPISLDGCERRLSQTSLTGSESNGVDEVDAAERLCPDESILTDSDFESAHSDISEPIMDATPLEDELPEDTHNTTSNKDLDEEVSNASKKLSLIIIDSPPSCELHALANGESTPEILCEAIVEPESPVSDPTLLQVDGKSSDEEHDDKPQRVRRCSSLKTGKTPPGTPGRKKIVRFADVLGLDLADVKTFMDEIPVIPKSAYEDLLNADFVAGSPPTYPAPIASIGKLSAKYLVPMFQQPRAISNVADLLHERQVCLESASVAEGAAITVCGSVRVRNLDFHKSVHVRYTLDDWKTYTDLQASYVPASCDGFSDKFRFLLYASSIKIGQKLQFAVRFQCKGRQYWDNNSGANYCYQCLPLGGGAGPPPTVHPMENWHPSFY